VIGRANHAGEGQWHDCPRDEGNTYFIGIETDHTVDELWTAGQRSAALAGVAALCDRLGIRTRDGLADYDTIKSEECVPLGHTVNANIAMVSAFSLHDDHAEAARRER